MPDEKTPIPDVYEWPEDLTAELQEQYGINFATLTESDDPLALVLAAGMGEATLRARIAKGDAEDDGCPFCGECGFDDGICEAKLNEDDQNEPSALCNCCPICGEDSIIAVCKVDVEYEVNDDGEGGQDWRRVYVDDDTSDPSYFRCDSCRKEWHSFELTDDGNAYLLSLWEPDTEPV